jgi:hypothetical protein
MTDTIKFQCDLSTTDASVPLGFEVLLNGKSVFRNEHITQAEQISIDIPDEDGATQKLQLIMSGKTTEHTTVDDQGTITSDAMLTISNALIDDIDIDQLLTEKTEYTHDFNGTQDPVKDQFYGSMGCNGAVTLEFTTPFYLWLLEHI